MYSRLNEGESPSVAESLGDVPHTSGMPDDGPAFLDAMYADEREVTEAELDAHFIEVMEARDAQATPAEVRHSMALAQTMAAALSAIYSPGDAA